MNTNTAFLTLRAGSNNPGTAPSPTTRRATRRSSRSCSTLTQSKVLERADLQAAIKTSWDSFAAELGYDDLFPVGSEVVPHESRMARLDLPGLRHPCMPLDFE